jgi:hypothetical protein
MPDAYAASNTYTTQASLDLAIECRARILATGKGYSISGRTLTLADLPAVNITIRELQNQLAKESGRNGRTLARRVMFR